MSHRTAISVTPEAQSGRRQLLALLFVVPLVAFACQKPAPSAGAEPSAQVGAAKPAAPPASEPLKVAFNQWVGFAGMYIADEKAFFEKHGIEVKLVPFSGPGDSIPPLLAGQIDISLTTANNIALVAGKQPTKAKLVYVIDASEGADAIVASASVKSMADLKKKRVAVTKGEINHMLLMLGLESVKLDESQISIVDMSPDDAGAAFMAGKVDAAVTWEPWVSRATEKGGHVIYSSKDPGAKDTLIDVIAASDEALAERKSDIEKFVLAFDEGVAFLKTQPAEARAILAKRLEAKPDDVEGMLSGARLYTRLENEKLLKESLPQTMAKVESFLKSHSLITRSIDSPQLISTALLTP
jgi:NitT/TauT family transport system substrate-binding protein